MNTNRLQKILEKQNLSIQHPPKDLKEWSFFLKSISRHLDEMESRQELLENTLATSSHEMERLYTDLKASSIKEKEAVIEKFKSLFDLSPLPYMFFNENGIIDCNKATVEILGGESKLEIISKHPASFSPEFQPDGRTSSEKSSEMDRLAVEKGFHRFEWMHKTLTGREFPVEVSITSVILDGKQALLVIWRDLTESKTKDQLLIHSSKMSSLGEMAAGIAHEINNPLCVIQGVAGILKENFFNKTISIENEVKRCEKILTMCERITKIILGLKSFSRSAEKDPFIPTDVNTITANILSLSEEKFKNLNIHLVTAIESNLILECRSTQIEQVLLNLLNNSLDAVMDLEQKWVHLVGKAKGDYVQISVTDSGQRIPANVLEKMMQPFFTTKGVGRGTGLGLSISKGIIEDHKGQFFYDQHSKNTSFVILLPRTQDP